MKTETFQKNYQEASYNLSEEISDFCWKVHITPSPFYYGSLFLGTLRLLRGQKNACAALLLGFIAARQFDYIETCAVVNGLNLADGMQRKTFSNAICQELTTYDEYQKKLKLKPFALIQQLYFTTLPIPHKFGCDHSPILHSTITFSPFKSHAYELATKFYK